MYNLRKRNRPSDAESGDKIASAQIKVVEIEKAIANVHCKETTILQWDPTENIATDYKDFYKAEGTIELRIDRFTEFAHSELLYKNKQLHKDQWRWSASIYIRGMPWKLCAAIRQNKVPDKQIVQSSDNERFLGLYLYCNKDSTSATSNCGAKFTLCVVAQKEYVDDFEIYKERNFRFDKKYNGRFVMSINTLLDPEKGFIKDDTVILRAFVKAEMPHGIQQIQDPRVKTYLGAFGPVDKTQLFSSSTKLLSNFVLIVQDQEVHVQTNFLSMHSKFFNEQFDKQKSANKVILQNIDYDEFTELLRVIYPIRYPITAENIETISKLAHIFKMTELLRQCEVFLMVNSSDFGRVKLLLIAHWYNLEHLQAKCIDEYKCENLKQLRKEQEFDVLDCQMKAILLDKFVEDNTSAAASAANCNKDSEQRAVPSTRASNMLSALVSSTSAPSDAVLIVEHQRIPIHKMYLSIYSEYFKAMFMGEFQEKNQEEIELEEVCYADILELLAVIYPTDSSVTEENIDTILKLADRFIMPKTLEKCKKALKCSSKMKTSLKLWLAQRYNFSDLQIEYAQQYKSVADVKSLKAEPEYALLDVKMRALIFDSITS